jgi:hypothetical protein
MRVPHDEKAPGLMTIEPLRLPPPDPSRLRRFIIGRSKQVYRSLCEQLRERDARTLDLWALEDRPMAVFLGHAAAEICEWPKPYFIPDDPFQLVAWEQSDAFPIPELAIVLEHHVGRRFGRTFWKELASEKARLVDVVRAVRGAAESKQGKTLRPWRRWSAIARLIGR